MKNLMMTSPSEKGKGNWTHTVEGFIRGKEIDGIETVVKTEVVGNDRALPKPKRTRDGHLIYALPGGLSWSNGVYIND